MVSAVLAPGSRVMLNMVSAGLCLCKHPVWAGFSVPGIGTAMAYQWINVTHSRAPGVYVDETDWVDLFLALHSLTQVRDRLHVHTVGT